MGFRRWRISYTAMIHPTSLNSLSGNRPERPETLHNLSLMRSHKSRDSEPVPVENANA
jgi:hypothetical protein